MSDNPKKGNYILELMKVFSSEEVCRQHLRKLRWDAGEYCPYCGCEKIYEFKDGISFKCSDCRKRFSIKVGTIFEDTKNFAPKMVCGYIFDYIA